MNLPKVTLIVIQRERFSLSKVSLESILADQSYPFDLIYVDGGSPDYIQQYLRQKEEEYDFIKLIRQENYLRVNQARNLALPLVEDSDYVIFIENDVIVPQGWLKPLIDCAETQQAAIVAPIILEGDPANDNNPIHIAGVNYKFKEGESGKKRLKIDHLMHHVRSHEKIPKSSYEVDATEFHCTLVRHSLLQQVELDEAFDSLESHIDLSVQIKALGGRVFIEPRSTVTFLNPAFVSGFDEDDLKFYRYKWSEDYIAKTYIPRAKEKWNLDPKDPYLWAIWRWALYNRQVPFKWFTSEKGLYRIILKSAKLRFYPSWLRGAIESFVLKATFPQEGVPCNLKKAVVEKKEEALTM